MLSASKWLLTIAGVLSVVDTIFVFAGIPNLLAGVYPAP